MLLDPELAQDLDTVCTRWVYHTSLIDVRQQTAKYLVFFIPSHGRTGHRHARSIIYCCAVSSFFIPEKVSLLKLGRNMSCSCQPKVYVPQRGARI